MNSQRPLTILSVGPTHLFWTTGLFYLFALGKAHDVVIISFDPQLERDPRMSRIRSLSFVRAVYTAPAPSSVPRHYRCRQYISSVLANFPAPESVYTHNINYIEEIYLVSLVRRRNQNANVIYYQLGRMYLDRAMEFVFRDSRDAAAVARRGVSLGAAKFYVRVRNRLASALHYWLAPMLLTGQPARPPVDVFTGENVRSNADLWNRHNLRVLSYTDIEAGVFRSEGFANVDLTEHPAKEHFSELFSLMGVSPKTEQRILVLPSWGFTPRMLETMTRDHAVGILVEGWRDALTRLLSRFPNRSIAFKLHPSAQEDEVWSLTLSRLSHFFPEIKYINSSTNAELLILQSEVVVGDVSSTLWWAALVGKPHVVSVDLFGYAGGDEMINYKGIETMQALSD